MATYAIGDIQGCFTQFQQLLQRIGFSPSRDRLWLTGDLVNRGPDSLAMLRWAFEHQDSLTLTLGNHDLHLLAVSQGYGRLKPGDTLAPILEATDGKVLLDWLRLQPLMVLDEGYAMVHAGLLPGWTLDQALDLATEVEDWLGGPHWREFFARMYGNKPARWDDSLTGIDRLRMIVNAMTRLRLINRRGDMDFAFKGELADAPPDLLAWFDAPHARWQEAGIPLVFGHWSALGLHVDGRAIGLDTGCLWGGQLTALRLSDRQLFQQACPVTRPIQPPAA